MEPRPQSNPLGTLLELGRRVRHAATLHELEFMVVNDSHDLLPYRQAALWSAASGLVCLSGVVQIEANAPYALWLNKVCRHLAIAQPGAAAVDASDLPDELGAEWNDWLPAHALWLPFHPPHVSKTDDQEPPGIAGGVLLVRDVAWAEHEMALMAEWIDTWRHGWQARLQPAAFGWLRPRVETGQPKRWWQRWPVRIALAALLIGCIPVRLSVLAPGELVPAKPAVIRAPLEGVLATFHVQPNQLVQAGDPLFGFDEILIRSQLDVARQALATAETEYRQTLQQALLDARSKAQLASLSGKIKEKRTEVDYLSDQLARAQVTAPIDGIALMDDPSEWIGRPVSIGERIMRVAAVDDVEVEAWVPMADAIPLAEQASVSLYLNASPLQPVQAELRYLAHDASERPDGTYAYRMRARLLEATGHRVGLKGTAKLRGRWVALAYWVTRRPLASIRSTLGW